GRFLLPLPWLEVRPGRPRLQRLPRLHEPEGSGLFLPRRQHPGDRRRRLHGERLMAAPDNTLPARKGFMAWLNKRLPVDAFVHDQLTGYYAPKNFNFWYFFGVLSLVALVIQFVSGIFIAMHYKVGE